jgi:hypothetical protein
MRVETSLSAAIGLLLACGSPPKSETASHAAAPAKVGSQVGQKVGPHEAADAKAAARETTAPEVHPPSEGAAIDVEAALRYDPADPLGDLEKADALPARR